MESAFADIALGISDSQSRIKIDPFLDLYFGKNRKLFDSVNSVPQK